MAVHTDCSSYFAQCVSYLFGIDLTHEPKRSMGGLMQLACAGVTARCGYVWKIGCNGTRIIFFSP